MGGRSFNITSGAFKDTLLYIIGLSKNELEKNRKVLLGWGVLLGIIPSSWSLGPLGTVPCTIQCNVQCIVDSTVM